MELSPLHLQYVISLSFTALTTFSLAIFVYLRSPRSLLNRLFAFYSISITGWSLGQVFLTLASDSSRIEALFWGRLLHIGVVFIPTTFVHFVFTILNLKPNKKLLSPLYLLSILFLLSIPSRLFVPDAIPKLSFKFFITAGVLYYFLVLFFVTLVAYGLFKLYKGYKQSTGIKRNQLKYLFWASLFGYLGGSPNLLLVLGVELYPLNPFGTYAVGTYIFVVAYAIVKYRLMDINIALTRAGLFFVVYFIILGSPFVMGYELLGKGLWVLPLVVMAVFATAGPYIYSYLQRKAESRLRSEEFEAHKALNRLAQNMMRVTKLDTLLKLIVHHVVKIMKVNFASIYLRDEENKHYHLRATRSINKTPAEQSEFQEDSSLVSDILLRRVPIVAEELSFGRTSKISPHLKKLQLELHRSKAAVVIPAFKGDYLFGFLLLGVREDNRLFTQEDLNLLLLLANQSVLAIENAQLFEKEKVLLAEKSRRDALADMAPGVAHQFNNRLISISMVADTQAALYEQEDLHKLSPVKLISLIEQSKNSFMSISKDAIRGKDIADAILKKGKAKLTYIKTDLAPIIQTAIELLKVSRTRKSLEGAEEPEVILDAEENLPKLILNESLIQDVFYNFIDNARDAVIIKNKAINENRITPDETPYKGKITITVRKKDNKVIVTVNDNGIGMDEKTKSRLFVPYFTTKATSLKGTGMGLWVIRSFIEDHKGKISFESEYGKGTTFTITFPIKEAKS